MTPLDDYQDDMGGLSTDQIESILEGRDVEGPAGERLSVLVRDLRRGLLLDPDPETARRHLAAMGAAGAPTVLSPRPRRVATKLALAAALLLGASVAAGATARLGDGPGILPEDLPIPARTDVGPDRPEPDARTAPGVTDDASEHPSRTDHGTTRAPSARSEDGCAKAAAATGAAPAQAQDPCARGGERGGGRGGGPAGPPEDVPGQGVPGEGSGKIEGGPAGPPSGGGSPIGRPGSSGSARGGPPTH